LLSKATVLLFGAVILLYSWARLLAVNVPKGNETIERALGCFYLSDDVSLTSAALQHLMEGPALNPAAAHDIFREVLERDAASADRWCDMGAILAHLGQIEKGKYCFLRAAQLAPNSPLISMSIGTSYVIVGQARNALPYFSKILHSVPEYDSRVFDYFDTMKLDFNEIVAYGGLPAESRPAQSYFRHLLATGDHEQVRKAWAWVRSHSFSDDLLASEYVNFLSARGLVEEAVTTWASQVGGREDGYLKPVVFNGDFEREPSGAVFDWRITPSDHVEVSRDGQVACSGKWSLRISFDGKENVNYQGVSQTVFVRPGTYRFEAFVRTADLTTDQGISLRVSDAEAPDRLKIETEAMTGTGEWRRLEEKLVVARPTRLMEIQVIRHASLKFDSLIAGTAWIDKVSLARMD
jgi:hypothetical protein